MIKNIENIKLKIQSIVDLYKSGDLSKAELLNKKLIEYHSKSAFLHNLLGLILAGQEKIEEAIQSYEKGINVDPKFAMTYNNLGLLYFHYKSDNEKAENLYKKSISLDSKIAEPHNNLGTLYNALDKFKEAIDCYKKAIHVNPKFAQPHHNIGNVYTAIGNFKKATIHFKESIKLNPSYSNSHRSLSRLIKYTNNENEHFKELIRIYEKINVNDLENKSNISFALGKAYEDIKDFDKSYNFYNEANVLHRKKVDFSMKFEREKFEEIKDTFNNQLYKKYQNSGNFDSSPIFILGMPRSGTTLIEQILSNHPKVFGAEEIEFIPQLIKKNFGNENLSLSFKKIADLDKNNLKKIGNEYILKMKNISNNSERSTDKFPANFLFIGFIKLILPKSKIIHCYRNSKDNCLSIFKNHFPGKKINFAYNMDEIVEYYNLYHDLMNFWNSSLPNFIFNMKYENLISNAGIEIRNLLKFSDLNWSDNCLNFHTNRKPIKTASNIQARSKIYSSSIHSWKNYEKYLSEYFNKLVN